MSTSSFPPGQPPKQPTAATRAVDYLVQAQARLKKKALDLCNAERSRLYEELHDGLGQRLTGAMFLAQALKRDLQAEKLPYAERAEKLAALIEKAVIQAHELARGVDSVAAGSRGLENALAELAARSAAEWGLPCEVKFDSSASVLDHTMATHLYRIAEDALRAARQMRGAARAEIALARRRSGAVVLTVRDLGGTRKQPGEATKRLVALRLRAQLIGATLKLSAPRDGSHVLVCRYSPDEVR